MIFKTNSNSHDFFMEFFLLIKYFLSILTLDYVDHDKYIEERVERTDKKINTFTHVYTSLVSDACISLW